MKGKLIIVIVVLYVLYLYSRKKTTPAVAVTTPATAPPATGSTTALRELSNAYNDLNTRVYRKLDSFETDSKADAVDLTETLTGNALILVLADESQEGEPRAVYYWDKLTLQEIILI